LQSIIIPQQQNGWAQYDYQRQQGRQPQRQVPDGRFGLWGSSVHGGPR